MFKFPEASSGFKVNDIFLCCPYQSALTEYISFFFFKITTVSKLKLS